MEVDINVGLVLSLVNQVSSSIIRDKDGKIKEFWLVSLLKLLSIVITGLKK